MAAILQIDFELLLNHAKGQLTRNLVGSIRVNCKAKIAKIVQSKIATTAAFLKFYFELLLINQKPVDLKLCDTHVSNTGPSWPSCFYSQDPEYKKIIGEFQTDPQGAMEKYKDHEDFQKFFREFCELMGKNIS